MNVKDHEKQEDIEITEKVDDTACKICRTLWKTYVKKGTWLICDTCDRIMYVPIVCQMFQIFNLTFRDMFLFM